MRGATPLSVCHEYRHQYGYLAPFFAALAHGKALGTECTQCNLRWFPPRPVCEVCGSDTRQAPMPPSGTVWAVTFTPTRGPAVSQGFALVRFGDAQNRLMVHVNAGPAPEIGGQVTLAPVDNRDDHAAVQLRVSAENGSLVQRFLNFWPYVV
ncbi:hypothetical protein Q672_06815 [Marinobacter sp. EVN1]|jgi:uncharacterized OB-fold protein|uniref:Zn-ribbon domain-containing OB-fold protein n=1 Tax=Marinobacter sp. EVN1 TaxID=1397532 RepID=UPI0003B85113|nr:hypothetical protein Q672_06815 [Marinobacter sp. EVN1]